MFYQVTTEDSSIILQCFVKDRSGELVDQPTGYPKINIFLMEGSGSTEEVALIQMSEDVNGEYYYEWDLTSVDPGIYKARYTVKIDEIEFNGFDVIQVKLAEDKYDGYGQ